MLVPNVPNVVAVALHAIHQQYAESLKTTKQVSLLSLFNSENFQFDLFCSDAAAHPEMATLKQRTTSFGQQYGILLPDADAYITCSMFLFPEAPLQKIITISKNYAVDFYLNDKMGRDAKPTNQEMQVLYEIRDRLAAIGNDLRLSRGASLAETANVEVLQEIANGAPKSWFDHFLRLYLTHIDAAHKSYDAATLGYIPSVEAYIKLRADISGMPHTVAMIEYANSCFLDWDELESAGLATDVKKANETVSYVGALTNDLFSFEKEVIDSASDSNLVFIVLANNFRMRLDEAIQVSGHIIRQLLADYTETIQRIEDSMETLPEMSKTNLTNYLKGLKAVLQACWTWQTYTQRYKRPVSIWQETSQKEKVTMKV
ncbi:hypothetical protein DCC81_03855 [Chitinophaga parva]|uniref:Terpene synthase n=1 Tax=Chitinophaga parva TaxID=2169414 RepID=A0A2T7BLS3_9BACT|nr:terpene synthase family protein [Chitinophaga parva]PUZ28628.1 hypothetical protein DCC81_03855 [Chitinophaga parva]